MPLDVAVADIFAGEFPITEDHRTLVSRTTATGYDGPDPARVEYYFGNLDARRVTWVGGPRLDAQVHLPTARRAGVRPTGPRASAGAPSRGRRRSGLPSLA